MEITKRDGRKVNFDVTKIEVAITKAFKEVYGSTNVFDKDIKKVLRSVYDKIKKMNNDINVEEIQNNIESTLCDFGYVDVARAFIRYRYKRELIRETNKRDESILDLLKCNNEEIMKENSHKDATIASVQRDYIAGEVCKDLAKRLVLPKDIAKAHEEGLIHFHDMDVSPVMNEFNCCLVNIKDMLDNGTIINGTKIDSPSSFTTACTIMTQIIASVASGQYGGQSINIKHLGKYLKRSYDKYLKLFKDCDKDNKEKNAKKMMLKDLRDGVQTIQYQINTIQSTQGQTPFVTLFLELDHNDDYIDYTALIIEEILKQRILGVKNEVGVYVTPVFPKLVFVLDDWNNLSGGEYDYITKLACKCTAKRMYPDYVSAKVMRERYEGNVFSPMGCRSFLSPWKDENGEYKFEGRFNCGVVSLNLPQIALEVNEFNGENKFKKFKELLDERLELCKKALEFRHDSLIGTKSDISPIHWQAGGIARLKKGEVIDKYLFNNYSTLSLGYIGLYEVTKLMTGESHTSKNGHKFAIWLITYLKDVAKKWKDETGYGQSLYATPSEGLCHRFAKIDKEKYGSIKDITDKNYYTNSFHVDVREPINAFDKFMFESEFQKLSSGGCISFCEIPNLTNNVEAIQELVKFIYNNVQYGEFNTKLDYCMECGFSGELLLDDNNEWYCPNCGNHNHDTMNVIRRTCGYLGDNFWNDGKTEEIKSRVLHLGMD